MATTAQIDANAWLSTGPRTTEGKAAVARNSTRHGFTGQFGILPWEDREAYHQLLADYRDEYRPSTPTEHFLVNELAQAQCRLERANAIQAEVMYPGDNPGYAALADSFRQSDNRSNGDADR